MSITRLFVLFMCILCIVFYILLALLLKDDVHPIIANARLKPVAPREKPPKRYPYPYVLKWSESKKVPRKTVPIRCGASKCVATNERELLPYAAAVMFTNLIDDLPLPRAPHQLWALSCSDFRYLPTFALNTPILDYFNYTSTFSRYSDLPLTARRLRSFADITRTDYMLALVEKRRLRKKMQLAKVAYFDFDLKDTLEIREVFVLELRNEVSIDMFGTCKQCKPLPKRLNQMMLNNKLDKYDPEFLKFMARYKFIIGYEDGVCEDFVTEKYWLPLVVGAVPIYFGAPNIRDWEPHDKSAIYIMEYDSVQELGEFILRLDRDDAEYNTYLRHKYELRTPITNERLLAAITARLVDTDFADFQCYICSQLHRPPSPSQRQRSMWTQSQSQLHNWINCTNPLASPRMWQLDGLDKFDWNPSRCQAIVMMDVLRRNEKISRKELIDLMRSYCH